MTTATAARAWVRSVAPGTSTCLYWNDRAIEWAVHIDGSSRLGYERTRMALWKSFDAWAGAECTDLQFFEVTSVEERLVSASSNVGENRNVILFRPDLCEDVVPPGAACLTEGGCSNEYDCFEFGRTVIAVTTTSFRPTTGEILDADIEFNEGSFVLTDGDGPPCEGGELDDSCVQTDLQNTATHEIGHLLGLDHSDQRDATMFGSAPAGEVGKRDLSEDDIGGICAIYPAGRPATACEASDDDPLVDGREGCACGAGGASAGLFGLLAWVGWSVGLRRRRRPN